MTSKLKDSQQINQKQFYKRKYLTQQYQQLKQILKELKQVNKKSKNLAKTIQQKSLTFQTQTQIVENTNEQQKIQQFGGDLLQLKFFFQIHESKIKNKIMQEQKFKKEDQLLFRHIIKDYEQKLTQAQKIVLQRQSQIQKLQKHKKQRKNITIGKYLLNYDHTNIQLFLEQLQHKQKYEVLSNQIVKCKLQINKLNKQIKSLQNLTLKFKLAKQTQMPYYKFMDMMKNGIQRMSDSDIKIYELIDSSKLLQQKNEPILRRKNSLDKMFELIVKKQKLNKCLFQKLIKDEYLKQNEYKNRINILKQAINLKEQKYIYKQLENLIIRQNEPHLQKWTSLSQKSILKKKQSYHKINVKKSQYQTYFQFLRSQIKNIPQNCRKYNTTTKSRSAANLRGLYEYQFQQFQEINQSNYSNQYYKYPNQINEEENNAHQFA